MILPLTLDSFPAEFSELVTTKNVEFTDVWERIIEEEKKHVTQLENLKNQLLG